MGERKKLILKLEEQHILTKEEWLRLFDGISEEDEAFLHERARNVCDSVYGRNIYIRGLIEFTNYCKNGCYYCGIRRSNFNACRYRMTPEHILDCCKTGYKLGFRTFVLQGGEDPWFTTERMAYLIRLIKDTYPDCALTLSVGEKDYATYRSWFEAGVDRYLLRHETANPAHYASLHPAELSAQNRKRCLKDLKRIGYQTGCGIMVGSPGQTLEHLAEDMQFMYELQPHMVGIGPFVPHHDTPFRDQPAGTLRQTLILLSAVRLMLPHVLLPSTTALATIDPKGREKGILAGANVVMPNLSPADVRKKYMLYDNKANTGAEAASHLHDLKQRMRAIGFQVVTDRGDWKQ